MSIIASTYSRFADGVDKSIDPKKPALLQPKRVVSRIENDVVGVCPFCKGKMEVLQMLTSEHTELDVYYCDHDRYVAPMPNGPVQQSISV